MNVYVMCPPKQATGGIELLNQLTAELNRHENVDAKIWFRGHHGEDLMPEEYEQYENPYDTCQNVPADAVVVVPEIWAKKAAEFKRPCIYWESVDNYVACYGQKTLPSKLPNHTIHLTQSEYARQFLMQNGVSDSIEVTDYLNDDFFADYEEGERKPVVLYNPRKGWMNTQKIIRRCSRISFIPIQNLERADVIRLMQRSMVYIDFGHHPGKDRIPREAAMCGLCVITGRDGSARYFEDVSIPEIYKIDKNDTAQIAERIRSCLENYAVRRNDFDGYRDRIRGEKERFRAGVKELVKRCSNTPD